MSLVLADFDDILINVAKENVNCSNGHTCVTFQNRRNENLAVCKRQKFEAVACSILLRNFSSTFKVDKDRKNS
jgi:ubiquinone/menaquinone biosynthesis C-methylase UbiE